jgi:hypothetical protein
VVHPGGLAGLAFNEDELERGLGDGEVGVAGAALGGLGAEELGVEGDRAFQGSPQYPPLKHRISLTWSDEPAVIGPFT